MSHEQRLRELLGRAYHAIVQQHGSRDAIAADLADALAADQFMAHAKAELARLDKVSKQCFVSKVQADFLRSVIKPR